MLIFERTNAPKTVFQTGRFSCSDCSIVEGSLHAGPYMDVYHCGGAQMVLSDRPSSAAQVGYDGQVRTRTHGLLTDECTKEALLFVPYLCLSFCFYSSHENSLA